MSRDEENPAAANYLNQENPAAANYAAQDSPAISPDNPNGLKTKPLLNKYAAGERDAKKHNKVQIEGVGESSVREKEFQRKVKSRPEGIETSDSSDDEEDLLPLPKENIMERKKRKSVSAEVYGQYNPKKPY